MKRKRLNETVLNGDFSIKHILSVKKLVPTMLGYYSKAQFDQQRSEREVETVGFVYQLKGGTASEEEIDRIVADISEKFGEMKFSFLTTTPDSGNVPGKDPVITGFSKIVERLAAKMGAELVFPEIVKTMEKQKTQSLKNRASNKRGGYSFSAVADKLSGKDVLFVDDVITSGATMCAIGEDLAKNGANFYGYAVSGAEMDADKA